MHLNSNKLFQTTIYIVIFQIIIWSLANGAAAESLRTTPRNLNLLTGNIKCKYQSSSTECLCPGSCMTQIGNTTNCSLHKCYAWNANSGLCEQTGQNHITPLVLQAIPFTGIFGAGFGNIGRWDLFGIYMGVLFGGCCFIVIATLLFAACTGHTEEEATGFTSCNTCLWSIALTALYIWGIVKIATPGDILDGNGCPLSGF